MQKQRLALEEEKLRLWLALIWQRRDSFPIQEETYSEPLRWPQRPQDQDGALTNT